MMYKTIKDAARGWVQEFNAIPQEVITKLAKASDYCDCNEITPPAICDRVYVFANCEYGEIIETKKTNEGETVYRVKLDNDKTRTLSADCFEVEHDYSFPMWGTMWTFGDSADDYWLEELGGLQIMADCGFRIYEQEDFGYVFGVDGCGYDFYEAHWIPLYKARGLKWHEQEEVTE